MRQVVVTHDVRPGSRTDRKSRYTYDLRKKIHTGREMGRGMTGLSFYAKFSLPINYATVGTPMSRLPSATAAQPNTRSSNLLVAEVHTALNDVVTASLARLPREHMP